MILAVFLTLTMMCGIIATLFSGILTLATKWLKYDNFSRFFFVTFMISLMITVISVLIIMIICLCG